MESLARCITKKLVEQNIIELKDEAIYHYGIQLILSGVWIFSWIIGIGILVNQLYASIIFIITMFGLRHYTGGYHANSYCKCFFLSCGSFIITLLMIFIQKEWDLKYTLIICSLLCTIYLCKKGSLNSEKNPKTDVEMHYRKQATRLLSCMYSLLSYFFVCVIDTYLEIAMILVCVQLFATLAMWIFINERRNDNEKSNFKRRC